MTKLKSSGIFRNQAGGGRKLPLMPPPPQKVFVFLNFVVTIKRNELVSSSLIQYVRAFSGWTNKINFFILYLPLPLNCLMVFPGPSVNQHTGCNIHLAETWMRYFLALKIVHVFSHNSIVLPSFEHLSLQNIGPPHFSPKKAMFI